MIDLTSIPGGEPAVQWRLADGRGPHPGPLQQDPSTSERDLTPSAPRPRGDALRHVLPLRAAQPSRSCSSITSNTCRPFEITRSSRPCFAPTRTPARGSGIWIVANTDCEPTSQSLEPVTSFDMAVPFCWFGDHRPTTGRRKEPPLSISLFQQPPGHPLSMQATHGSACAAITCAPFYEFLQGNSAKLTPAISDVS